METGLEGPAEAQAPAVITAQESLIGDLLSMDIGGPVVPVAVASVPAAQPQAGFSTGLDLLGGGLDTLVSNNKIKTD
jgi:AP-1 complex subunit beta-1